MIRAFLLVGLGGAIGSMSRYGVSIVVNRLTNHHFPFATFLINIVGCFLIGLLFGLGQKQYWTRDDVWLILGAGFCGGFTTFSAFALENVNLFGKHQSTTAIVYCVLSVVLGIILCRAGILLIK